MLQATAGLGDGAAPAWNTINQPLLPPHLQMPGSSTQEVQDALRCAVKPCYCLGCLLKGGAWSAARDAGCPSNPKSGRFIFADKVAATGPLQIELAGPGTSIAFLDSLITQYLVADDLKQCAPRSLMSILPAIRRLWLLHPHLRRLATSSAHKLHEPQMAACKTLMSMDVKPRRWGWITQKRIATS